MVRFISLFTADLADSVQSCSRSQNVGYWLTGRKSKRRKVKLKMVFQVIDCNNVTLLITEFEHSRLLVFSMKNNTSV